MSTPRISVVTCSFNQAAFIGRTIESVLAQDYPDLEHIVVDGMSTDGTAAVLRRYSHLRVIREPDRGQADAINKGFALASGEIQCFLNSDDTLLPGALRHVAREIDALRGRHVVMGRCRFIDEDDRFIGIEHPSDFESHRRVLEIWKGHTIPQPAVFWTREVWDRCGPLDEDAGALLDYDLFCRMSRLYRFHLVDEVLACYRLHSLSQTAAMSDDERLRRAVAVSRRYWGSPLRPGFWAILLSYSGHLVDRRRRAARLLRGARDRSQERRFAGAAASGLLGSVLGPDVALDLVLLPLVRSRFASLPRVSSLRRFLGRHRAPSPRTLAYRDFTGIYPDRWVGPVFLQRIQVAARPAVLHIAGAVPDAYRPRNLRLRIFVDGDSVADLDVVRDAFTLRLPLGSLPPGDHELRIESSTSLVFDDVNGGGDFRPLAFRLDLLQVAAADDGAPRLNSTRSDGPSAGPGPR